ncbi:MAG: hypothetical protein GY778_32300, partial [bacterium]|nr:hypothetical protein [bacterium]
TKLFYTVNSVDDVEFRPNLEADQEAVKSAFVDRYRTTIGPPTAELIDDGFAVRFYAVREQALERHTVRIGRGGEVAADFEVVEAGLPLVYGM